MINKRLLEKEDQHLLAPVCMFSFKYSYISPQLLEDNVSAKESDLWALGCIVYQLYYMETPFKDKTEYGTFQKIKNARL